MMNEIGGYFQLEKNSGREYHENYIALNTGRNALVYLMRARAISKVYLPDFLCTSVSLACEREGFAYETYQIGEDFMPCFDKTLGKEEYLYIVNYYGQIDDAKVRELRAKYGNIILDNSHAFFMKAPEGIDTLYTCRKFFGVPDGSYLATDLLLDEELEQDKSIDRLMHLFGRFEGVASDWHSEYRKNEEAFKEVPLRTMSELTHNFLRGIDYEGAIARRNDNFDVLAEALDASNGIKVNKANGPFAYPYYVKDGVRIRKALAEKKIYIATLWPNVAEEDSVAGDLARNILPLPCDHRYSKEDMEFICSLII